MKTIILLIFALQALAMPQNEKDCKDQGFNWIAGQGCVVTQQTVETRQNVQECAQYTDAALESCIQRVTREASASVDSQHRRSMSQNDGIIYATSLVQVLGTAYMFIKHPSSCTQTSYWLMLAGSVATLAGEILARVKYNNLTKKAQENYEGLQIEENSSTEANVTQKQLAAFDNLIEVEQAREKAEKTRKTLYNISLYSYAGAAVAAALEAWVPALLAIESTCAASYTPEHNKSIDVRKLAFIDKSYSEFSFLHKITSTEFMEIILRKLMNQVMPSANAGVGNFLILGPALLALVEAEAAAGSTYKTKSAVMRIASAALLGTSSALVGGQARRNEEIAIERQNELRQIRNEFAQTAGIMTGRCTSEMRRDRNNPHCYCYNEDGSKDLRKQNLQMCNEIWGSGFNPVATNYNSTDATNDISFTKTCITKSFESDLGCKCKAKKNCLKVKPDNLKFGQNMGWTNPVFKASEDAYSNGLEAASLKNTDYVNKAGVLKKKLDELKKKKDLKKVFKQADTLQAKMNKSTKGRVEQALKKGSLNSLLAGFDSSKTKKKKKKVAKVQKKNLPAASVVKGKKNKSFELDFGDEEKGGIEISEEAKLTQKDNYEYDAVLHKNPDHDIFKIISNRYMNTGVKKLFEGESKQ